MRLAASTEGHPAFTADAHFRLALLAGPVVWLLLAATPFFDFAPGAHGRSGLTLALVVIAYPLVEEWLFRGIVQPALAQRIGSSKVAVVSRANVITSLLFAIAHLPFHPPAFALATFAPSLVFGHCRDRFGSVMPGAIVHVVYNAGFFLLLAPV